VSLSYLAVPAWGLIASTLWLGEALPASLILGGVPDPAGRRGDRDRRYTSPLTRDGQPPYFLASGKAGFAYCDDEQSQRTERPPERTGIAIGARKKARAKRRPAISTEPETPRRSRLIASIPIANCPASFARGPKIAHASSTNISGFCLDHVRGLTQQGRGTITPAMSQAEIERHGCATTWSVSGRPGRSAKWGAHGAEWPRLCAAVRPLFPTMWRRRWTAAGAGQEERVPARRQRRSSRPQQGSGRRFAVLELTAPVTMDEIRTRYRILVKKLHPDANGGDKSAEEQFESGEPGL